MPQLPLHKEEVAVGAQVRQVTVRMPQKLHAGPIAQTTGTENPHDAPVQASTLERPPAIVEQQRLTGVGRINRVWKRQRPDFTNVAADQLCRIRGDIHATVVAMRTVHFGGINVNIAKNERPRGLRYVANCNYPLPLV